MKSKKKTLIFFVLYTAYMSIYIARVNLSVAGPSLTEKNLLDSAELGLLGSCFFCIYALGRIINGALSDRTHPKIMLAIGLLFTGISNIFVSFLPPYAAIVLFWIINAYAQSMLWSSVLCSVTSIYNESEAKKKSSVMVTSVATGNIFAIILNTFLITRCNLRLAFAVPGIITIIFAVLTYIALKKIKFKPAKKSNHISPLDLIKNKEMLKMNLAAIFHGIMKENIGLWMALYIVDTYLVDLTTSSFYILLIPTIGFIGRMIYPLIYKTCRFNEHKVSLIGFIVCGIFSALLCFEKTGIFMSTISLSIIYASVSVINTSIVSIYPLSYSDTGNTASVSGMLDFSTYLGAGLSSSAYGIIIKHFGYMPMFVSWIVISLISIVIMRSKIKSSL